MPGFSKMRYGSDGGLIYPKKNLRIMVLFALQAQTNAGFVCQDGFPEAPNAGTIVAESDYEAAVLAFARSVGRGHFVSGE
jgi:hypothetical protein